MRFHYQARNKQGQTQIGVVEASSKEAALNVLQKYGLYVTYLSPEKKPIYARQVKLFQGVSTKDIVLFTRQLSVMFKSEVSLVDALRSLADQTKNEVFQEKILELAQEVEGGSTFSKALSKFPRIFNPLFISMVKSGEVSGRLSEVLEYLASHLEREYELRSRIIGAMLYPAMVIVVAIAVFLLMILYVLPNMLDALAEFETELPLLTKIVLAVSRFFGAWWWLMGIVALSSFSALYFYIKTEQGKKNFDAFLLKIPIVGQLSSKIFLTRFAHNLSLLIIAGLSIVQAMELSAQTIGNEIYKEAILAAREGVRRGEMISNALRQYKSLFPPMVIQMIYVGERSGSVGKTLSHVASFYQAEVQRAVDNILTLLEPILIIFLGGIVAIIVSAVLLPLYSITGV